ncbi:MAG: 2-oxo acid dehydrogenase subunit E2 [Bacteroidales bacterium]|nr:2-oxo acid dehydrogenase subunit E2 [Bacteroidales bacterium]
MSQFEIVMPKLGESIQEATITKWFVSVGDKIEEDDVLVEIATDKVDSEIPSPVEGVVKEILYKEGDTIAVGEIIAIVDLDSDMVPESKEKDDINEKKKEEAEDTKKDDVESKPLSSKADLSKINEVSNRFYSPLVKNIAIKENIGFDELEKIKGTGKEGRVRKEDILKYIEEKTGKKAGTSELKELQPDIHTQPETMRASESLSADDEIIEMDRMRRLIADHMVMSKKVSPHVTSVVEADVTNIVIWKNRIKDDFTKKHGVKITYMPVFIEAVVKALIDFPDVNVSVDGYKIIKKKNINIGIAVSLPNGNLIVPVIKKTKQMNLVGLTIEMNRLANAARNNKLNPDDIQDGTFTITNFGSFRNIMGAPIINQPQVAILATGSIEKKPAVIETPSGDAIGIRHKMFLSLTYDHRVVDGALGGAFLRRIADYLEEFDINRKL